MKHRTDTVETKVASRRLVNVVAIFLLFYAATLFFMLKNRLFLDDVIISSVLNLISLGVLFICLIRRRISGRQENPTDTYGLLCIVIAICWIVLAAGSILPDNLEPIPVIVFLLFTVLDELGAVCMSLYFATAFSVFESVAAYTVYAYLGYIVANSLLADYMKNNKDRYKPLILFAVGVINLFMPMGFSYLAYHSVSIRFLLQTLIYIAVLIFVVIFVFPYLISLEEESRWTAYEDILQDDYPLVVDMKSHSGVEYIHARRVSNLSAKCAHEIGAGEMVSACGGLYYRMNVLIGGRNIRKRIKKAVEIASENCFPPDVIEIIGEFEGVDRLPQTRESAIVHMVDALVTKIEILDREAMSSDWNQDMVIYQTLNDFSSQGIYDESDLSMNQFLKVRELLVREGVVR